MSASLKTRVDRLFKRLYPPPDPWALIRIKVLHDGRGRPAGDYPDPKDPNEFYRIEPRELIELRERQQQTAAEWGRIARERGVTQADAALGERRRQEAEEYERAYKRLLPSYAPRYVFIWEVADNPRMRLTSDGRTHMDVVFDTIIDPIATRHGKRPAAPAEAGDPAPVRPKMGFILDPPVRVANQAAPSP
jgi:hypothetical protein